MEKISKTKVSVTTESALIDLPLSTLNKILQILMERRANSTERKLGDISEEIGEIKIRLVNFGTKIKRKNVENHLSGETCPIFWKRVS